MKKLFSIAVVAILISTQMSAIRLTGQEYLRARQNLRDDIQILQEELQGAMELQTAHPHARIAMDINRIREQITRKQRQIRELTRDQTNPRPTRPTKLKE